MASWSAPGLILEASGVNFGGAWRHFLEIFCFLAGDEEIFRFVAGDMGKRFVTRWSCIIGAFAAENGRDLAEPLGVCLECPC